MTRDERVRHLSTRRSVASVACQPSVTLLCRREFPPPSTPKSRQRKPSSRRTFSSSADRGQRQPLLCPDFFVLHSQPIRLRQQPYMLSDPSSIIPVDDSARRFAFTDMDSRYDMASTSPLAQSHFQRMARLQDGRAINPWERECEMHDPFSKSPARRQSTIPIPDLSTLTMGVPEMVIANTANDPHVVSTSPPQRRRLPVSTTRKQRDSVRRSSTQDAEFKVMELGATMAANGVTPIEEIIVEHQEREREPVPGIDTQRPSIGVTRPSDDDNREVGERNRKFVEGWAGDERHEGSRRGTSGDGQMVSGLCQCRYQITDVPYSHLCENPSTFRPYQRRPSDGTTTHARNHAFRPHRPDLVPAPAPALEHRATIRSYTLRKNRHRSMYANTAGRSWISSMIRKRSASIGISRGERRWIGGRVGIARVAGMRRCRGVGRGASISAGRRITITILQETVALTGSREMQDIRTFTMAVINITMRIARGQGGRHLVSSHSRRIRRLLHWRQVRRPVRYYRMSILACRRSKSTRQTLKV